eukprot:72342-Hanusia_phi.AAC.1
MLPLRTLAFVVQEPQEPASDRTASLAAVLFGADDPSDFLPTRVRASAGQGGTQAQARRPQRGACW